MYSLAHPELLFLLPLPLIIRWLLPPTTLTKSPGLLIPFYQRLLRYTQTGPSNTATRRWQGSMALLIWCLLVVASAAPQWVGPAIELPQNGRDIILALDLSGSMNTPDMHLGNETVNRVTLVKSVAHEFINRQRSDRLGLVLFGTRAYLQTPLTFDRRVLQAQLNDATVGLAGQATAIGDAIGIAIKKFKSNPNQAKVIVLLTDGINNAGTLEPLQAARIAAEKNIKIYTVGLGANQVVVNTFYGPQVMQNPDPIDDKELKEIATLTKGQFFRANDEASLKNAYESISLLEPSRQDSQFFHPITALYHWPLLAALALSGLIALSHVQLRSRQVSV
jgi:Ca-activated chloride channel family protein